mgnify:CR=1 FL=1
MPVGQVRYTALEIINRVRLKQGLLGVANFEADSHTNLLLNLLNEVIEEVTDVGEWPQLFREQLVTAISSTDQYLFTPTSGNIKNIHEIGWANRSYPMQWITVEEMRQLRRGSRTSTGAPIFATIVGMSGSDPFFRVHPVPITADVTTMSVAYYKMPRLTVTADSTAAYIPVFPGPLLVQGLYAKALLDENDGVPTPEYTGAYQEFQRMLSEVYNRLGADTGPNYIKVSPGRSWR